MDDPVRALPWGERDETEHALPPEWLVGNGLGGFASGTVTGVLSRRYHGLLIAALPVPLGRMVMLDGLSESLILPDGRELRIGADQVADEEAVAVAEHLQEFRLELGLPVWRYAFDGIVLERRLFMRHEQNTVLLDWRLLESPAPVRLCLRPFLHVRPIDGRVSEGNERTYQVISQSDRHEIAAGGDVPTLKLQLKGGASRLILDSGERRELYYAWEAYRGYDCRGSAWSPGGFRATLSRDHECLLTISTEPWEEALSLMPREAMSHEIGRRRSLIKAALPALHHGVAAELVIAADSFVFSPPRRGPQVLTATHETPLRSVIAGYHWFTDWGRDTMISLEGLTLMTGREREARGMLQHFASHVRNGLIPNLFPEHDSEGVYNTADATLWFFHALDRYLQATGDRELLRELLPTLADVVRHHLEGTRFGIGVDPEDGLLRQGADGYQLTWMDAKVGDWVVTPRRGKAVEINALWYNALRLLATWTSKEGGDAELPPLSATADQVYRSFNRRFWSDNLGYLYDVIDGEEGDDAKLRPNQIFAISLPHPVLDPARWQAVLDVVERHLLTPVGLRSLAPDDPDYEPRYWGDLRARDAAYHQGTVWAWLIGPFVDAWLKLHPGEYTAARRFLDGFDAHLSTAGVGSISEIFDADQPWAPRGCIAQAWSVAEVLRSLHSCAG